MHIITDWDAYVFYKQVPSDLPMLFHFLYDIFANLASFVEWNDSLLFLNVKAWFEIVLAIMFILSLIMLIRKEN